MSPEWTPAKAGSWAGFEPLDFARDREIADNLTERQGGCGLDFAGGPGSCGAGVDTEEGEVDLVELAERGAPAATLSITRVDGRGVGHE